MSQPIPIKAATESKPIPFANVDSGTAIPVKDNQIRSEIGPIKGFRNNLRLPWSTWDEFMGGHTTGAIEDNLVANIVRVVTDNTTEDKLRRKYGDAKVDEIIAKERERGGVDLKAMKEAFNEDPGAFVAEFVNGVIADPELVVTPLGWRTAASKTAVALKGASTLKKTAAANIAGAGGASLTAAGLIAPISIAEQLDKTGDISWDRVGEETALAAGLAVVLGSVGAKKFSGEKAIELAESTVGSAQVHAIARTPIAEAVSEALDSMRNTDAGVLGRMFLDKTGAKSVTLLDDAAKYSPTLKALRNKIEYQEFSDVPIGPDHFERVSTATGRFVTRLQEIMDKTRTPMLGIIKRADNDKILNGLRGGKQTVVSRGLRNLLNEVREYAIEAGLDVGEIADYFPRIYNVRKLKKNEDAFIKALTDNGVDAGDASVIHARIVDNDGIFDTANRIQRLDVYGRPTAKAGALERSRHLKNVPDEALAPFLENDVYGVIQKYIINSVKRAEFARSFGVTGGKLNYALRTAMDEMKSAGRPMKGYELNRVYDIVDALQGMYRPHESRAIAKASKVIGTYELVRTLTMATLSSITEPMVILARGRWDSAIKSLPKLFKHTAASWVRLLYKRFPKPEVTRAVERVGIGLDESVGEVLTQTFGGEANRVTATFFKATLLAQWTRMNRIIGYHTGRQMVIDNLKDIAEGRKYRFGQKHEELVELGVPVKEGLEWLKRGMPDDDFAKIVDNAGLRFTNEVVMNPRVTNRPLWHSNPNMHLLAQLKGFPTVFGNTVMKRWFKKILEDPMYHGPKTAAVGTAMVMMALMVNDMRDELKGIERNEDEYQRVVRAIDRTGMTGIGQMAIDAMYAHRYGRSGLSQILGPFAQQLDAALAAAGEAKEGNLDPLRGEIGQAIPVINQKREWREKVEEALGAED